MRVELKGMNSPDIHNLEEYSPDIEDNFCFLLQIMLGPKGEQGYEMFDMVVCTPKWILENKSKESIIFGKNYLIVFEYNYHKIYQKIRQYIDNIEGHSWDEIALKISRIAYWEFEDYKERR